MSDNSLPASNDESSRCELAPGAVELLKNAIAVFIEKEAREPKGRRREGRDGGVAATMFADLGFARIAPDVVAVHRRHHRDRRERHSGKVCLARDVMAVGMLTSEGWYPPTGWPIYKRLARVVEQVTEYPIRGPKEFADHVARDIKKVRILLTISPRKRTAQQKRFISRYSAAAMILRNTVGGNQGLQESSPSAF